jgi:hypothetical protein
MTRILNLTQHVATPDQVAVGVFEPKNKAAVQALLTFDEMPTQAELRDRAWELKKLTTGELTAPWPWENDGSAITWAVMIGGAPYFMAHLEHTFRMCGIQTLYAFAKRESVDEAQADGSIKKTQVFRHAGFIEVE